MGDDDCIEVRRKNRGSVFNRLSPPIKSSADDLAKVSTSVYISNFSSHLTVRELWNICGKKGTLADVFIANHKNKMGQMFGFCRFIKVNCSNTLISSLNNIRIGKMRLHANKARFGRKSVTPKPTGKKGPSTWHNPPSNAASYANVTKSAPNHGGTNAN
ncbi:RNA-directed DNA polymerase, eukaryota, partial [Tanacetum coccineum]